MDRCYQTIQYRILETAALNYEYILGDVSVERAQALHDEGQRLLEELDLGNRNIMERTTHVISRFYEPCAILI